MCVSILNVGLDESWVWVWVWVHEYMALGVATPSTQGHMCGQPAALTLHTTIDDTWFTV
jgi:hypothetical protein